MRQYGMLASIGATPGQIKKNVYYEAFILAAIGIPLGVLLGLLASYIVSAVVGSLLSELGIELFIFTVSPLYIIVSVALAVITIYFSALSPARKATKVSPISAITNVTDSSDVKKEFKTPGYVKKFFGMGGVIAHKNMKRTKKRYRVVTFSIAASVTVFIAMFYFMDLLMQSADVYDGSDHNITWNVTDWRQYKDTADAIADESTEGYCFSRELSLTINTADIAFNSDYYSDHVVETELFYLTVCSLGDTEYERFAEQVGISVEEAAGGAILVNTYMGQNSSGTYKTYEIYDISEGDAITANVTDDGEPVSETVTLNIMAVTDEIPTEYNSKAPYSAYTLNTGLIS